MTDRELLELAAKAAGYSICHEVEGKDCLALKDPKGYLGDEHFYWNPLKDDGDALRLAVKIGVVVDSHGMYSRASFPFGDNISHVSHGDDPYAATRRAIVLAAAEIGKEIK